MKYKNKITAQVVEYIKKNYDVDPAYLWARTPNNAAFRHKQDNKWFGALLLETPLKRLGIDSDENVDILDLKLDPMMIANLVDREKYFPGYHMNKEHWITVLLDGSVSGIEIYNLIDMSFELTYKKK